MTIEMPSLTGFVRRSNFWLETNTQTFTSPINKSTQTLQLAGALWRLEITLRRMTRAEATRWLAFFLQLRGMSQDFYGYDPAWREKRGVGGGTPLVKGASQTGNDLDIDGCTANVTGWGKAGDYFTCNDQHHQLTQDANTNGSGETTLYFEPYMRESPADNAPVTIDLPKAKMILTDDQALSWPTDHNDIFEEKTFTAMEFIE